MATPKEIVAHYIDEFHEGRCEDAFFGLIDLDPDLIPELIEVYESSDDRDTKVFVIRVVSEFRKESGISFLRHALHHDDDRIWKRALDGLAMTGSQESVDAMDHVLSSVADVNKQEWIQEAISDTVAGMKMQNKSCEATGENVSS